MKIPNWMSVDAENIFVLPSALLSPLGLRPLLEENFCLQFRWSIAFVEIIMVIALAVHEMLIHCNGNKDLMENMLLTAGSINTLSVLTFFRIHREKLKASVILANGDWSSVESSVERDIMKYYAQISKKIIFGMVAVMFWGGFSFYVSPMLFSKGYVSTSPMWNMHNDTTANNAQFILQKKFIFPSTCTFNNLPQPYYSIVIVNQAVQLVIGCIASVGNDALFVALTAHLYGQFTILRSGFQSMCNDANPLALDSMETKSKKMFTLIAKHQYLLSFSALLENTFNEIILMQFLVCSVIIPAAGFSLLISHNESNLASEILSVGLMQTLLVRAFMFSYVGELLQKQNDKISDSVYGGPWYELPGSLSKNLVFVIMRSNMPPHLTAGKFFNVTHGTFVDLLKTCYSYLSVLRLMIVD